MDLNDHSSLFGRFKLLVSRITQNRFIGVTGMFCFGLPLLMVWIFSVAVTETTPLLQRHLKDQARRNSIQIPIKTNSRFLNQKYILIDTDAGIDDAWAIFLCLRAHRDPKIPVTVVGITTSHGNTGLENVTRNVAQVLAAAHEKDIPVFHGSKSALVLPIELEYNPFVGADGFGDTELPPAFHSSNFQPEHAVNAIARLAEEYANKGQPLSILAIAPLTNLATAVKMYPNTANNLKEILILGGNFPGKENAHAEFNFIADAEAAYIVLENLQPTPLTIIPFKSMRKRPQFHCEFRKETLMKIESDEMTLLNVVEAFIIEKCADYWYAADSVAAAIIVEPTSVTKWESYHSTLALTGDLRGQMIFNELRPAPTPNVHAVVEFDLTLYKKMMVWTAGGPYYNEHNVRN